MHEYKIYEKLKKILEYVQGEANKTHGEYDINNYYVRIWNKGYRKAMIAVRDFIWEILNKDD